MNRADPRYRDLDPIASPLPPPMAGAREAFARSVSRFLAIPDDALEREWGWIGGGETDVRSGFYIALQRLEEATGAIRRARAAAGIEPAPATGALAAATEARWELHGVLAPLGDDVLDDDPGGGEWTLRQTLAHILGTQRAYPWFSAWWLEQRDAADYASSAPDDLDAELPTEDQLGTGSLHDIRARLDGLVDLSTEAWRDASDEDLAVRARWSGYPVPIAFRVGRWSTHMEEHTVQVDKTLAFLAIPTREVDRLVRLLHRAFGRMEAAVWGLPEESIPVATGEAMEAVTAEVERIAGEVVSASAQAMPS